MDNVVINSVSITELIERKEQIEMLIYAFNQQWQQHCVSAVVWDMPLMLEQTVADNIQLRRLSADKAIQETKAMLLCFERKEKQHPATVIRLPGIIRLTHSYYANVAEINAYKDALMARIHTIHPRTRPKYTRIAWPNTSTLQLYRHINAPYSTKRKVLFSWVGHTTSSSRISRDQIIATVNLSRALPPLNVKKGDWDIVIDKELSLLSNLPFTAHLVRQKQVAPHPRVMVYHQEEKQPTRTYGANLPLFIPENKSMAVRELANWDKAQAMQRKQRKDKLPSVLLIPRLHLYLRQ